MSTQLRQPGKLETGGFHLHMRWTVARPVVNLHQQLSGRLRHLHSLCRLHVQVVHERLDQFFRAPIRLALPSLDSGTSDGARRGKPGFYSSHRRARRPSDSDTRIGEPDRELVLTDRGAVVL